MNQPFSHLFFRRRLRRALSAALGGDASLSSLDLFCMRSTGSTNEDATRYAKTHPGRAALFVADRQTAGKGQRGRSFYSPAGSGLYMTLLLPSTLLASIETLTVVAAVAVCRAIAEMTDADPKIKWVNDVYLGGKKACGILAEGAFSEDGTPDFAVVGIGINLSTRAFPEELAPIATSLAAQSTRVPHRADLCARIAATLLLSHGKADGPMGDEYRARSFLDGKPVRVTEGERTYPATAVAVTDDFLLRVRLADGTTRDLRAGDVFLAL